mgnify:CR=1 FL=1|tara:strand:- start:1595 stop:2446 length:852 start_codon:yes stop_codon:yes gene_type:complete
MVMTDIKAVNEEFRELSDRVAILAREVIDTPNLIASSIGERTNRIKARSDLYKKAPHWDLLPANIIDDLKTGEMDPCGKEYLNYQMDLMRRVREGKGPVDIKRDPGFRHAIGGYPNKEPFTSLINLEGLPDYPKNGLREAINELAYKFLGGHSIALAAFYPPNSYIPWHHNGNAPGYNMLMHYSWGGNGAFYSYADGEIIEYPDKDREWSVRSGRFLNTGTDDERNKRDQDQFHRPMQTTPVVEDVEKASWHCAQTYDWRFTLSTIINYEDIWLDVIDELESE